MPAPARRRTDHKGFVGWLLRPAARVYVGVLFLGLCVLFGLFALGYEQRGAQLRRDEHNTCVIQQRGLPAGHELAASMADIHALLTFPPTPAARREQAQVPPWQLRRELAVLKDLDAHLAKYSAAEAKQPQTRRCP